MVVEEKNPTSLRMKFDLRRDELTNKTKVKSRTYSNLKSDATSQHIYDAAKTLEGLQEFSVIYTEEQIASLLHIPVKYVRFKY